MAVKSTAKDTMVWTDDETELLLNVTLEYKAAKAAENEDWESVRSKYQDILEQMKTYLPVTTEGASRIEKGIIRDKISKQVLTSKLKAIRIKYRAAVDSGRRSGHGQVVLIFFEQCEKIWGGCPTTERIDSGLESTDLNSTQTCAEIDESQTGPGEPQLEHSVTEDLPSTSGLTEVQQRRALLNEKLCNYKQAKLKRKLPLDVQLIGCVKEDVALKRRPVEQMEKVKEQHQEQMQKMLDNMDKLTQSIADGFGLLQQLLASPQPRPTKACVYPIHPPVFQHSEPPTICGCSSTGYSNPYSTSSSCSTTPQSRPDSQYYCGQQYHDALS